MVCCCKLGTPCLLLVFTYMWLWSNSIHNIKAGEHDSLKLGGTLNDTHQLCSENGKSCIRFFQQTNSTTFLDILIRDDFVIWTANRNQPITNGSGILSLDNTGVLKIESEDWNPIILYSPPPQSTNNISTVATLLDSGNFVVQQLNPNGSTKRILWQSFDYPTDNLFPGMKLGVNHKTGRSWSLVSWVSQTLPTSGNFKLEWEPKERELVITRIGKVLWKSGKLIKNRFEHIPEDSQHKYSYTIVSNEDEDYFTFTTSNEDPVTWTMYQNGQVVSSDGKDIAKADKCYGYNNDGGCQKWEIPTCRDSSDVFESKTGYLNFSSDVTRRERNRSYGIGDCQAICWSNCTCAGFMSLDEDDESGCIFFLGKSLEGFISVSVALKFNMIVKKPHRRGTKKWIWLSVVIATSLLIVCTSTLFIVKNRRKCMVEDKRRGKVETEMHDITSEGSIDMKDLEDELNKGHDFKVFSYASVMEATDNFSSENKLGQGGFGPVYKGILPTGREVAVKRLSKTSGQGVVEFKNELKLICELQHMNLVQLIGCCICEHERILIYEYMSNKSLDFFLFDSTRSKLLNWSKRFNIIEGISQGLLYLHKYSRVKIIHRDLKAGNILLDENMNPKISDFGMARMFTLQESTVNTNRIVGTYGYMSPEYVMEGVFSTKSDIYSFGVLLLEIVSGRKNNSFYDVEHPLNLVGHAWELWKDGVCLKLMDPSLNGMFDPDEAQRCIHVGLLCVEHYAKDRPDMSDIISMLTNKSVAITMPTRPAFYFGRKIFEGETYSKSIESNTDSTKEISTSAEVEQR
ncbi:PREDICTED: LOW QUALITY PROTEIN: G-type lectin S-receptor-like serine/threonine-protein kinase At1g67520 [Lupinus angustifolius]|uniref:LOW QUALITY PROTEIN: G-type lectin S-receptor-like serine/threonine-protein kinase At1g67520 n=1 Tax=Lupinus angustifolius TaxID=3871 RepID=UPI00092EC8D6|nr:PREDICTED: LOW QUALITY PROTEIN: G-type lectin S-receptor-like serine/threonine-protein kinase At1g67520 [Lupinus angustifolius]